MIRAKLCLVFLLSVYGIKAHAFAVATGTPWATEAAAEILRQGGNATDAMVAASFVLNVTQPYNMGVGGGGFFLASKEGKVYFWDHREMAPDSAHEKMFLKSNGDPISYYPERVTGPNPVGIPGTVAGLYEAHKKLGKLPWKRLLKPAIRIAHDGFPLSPKFAEALADEWSRISMFPFTAATFGNGEGGPLPEGRMLKQPLLAQTLEKIANGGAPAFYTGELSRTWISEAQKLGIKINSEDLKNYKVRSIAPISFHTFDLDAVTAAPPSGAGITVAATLRYLEHYYQTHDLPTPLSATRIIVTTEALHFFQQVRDQSLADPPYGKIDPQKFFNSRDEKLAWDEIDKRIGARLDRIQTRFTQNTMLNTTTDEQSPHSHTAHMSIVDDHGMAVSYTTTIEEVFGSGLVVPGHGFLLNNELSDFAAEPGRPNSPASHKRPRSNMSPLIFFKDHKPVGVIGCAGGGRIPTVLVEVLEGYHLHKMGAREALASLRFHPTGDNKLQIEKSAPASVLQQLKDAGYILEVGKVGGAAMALLRRGPKDSWEVASEPRTDGLALSGK